MLYPTTSASNSDPMGIPFFYLNFIQVLFKKKHEDAE